MTRTARIILKQAGFSFALFALLIGLGIGGPRLSLPRWILQVGFAGWALWVVALILAPFGIGPLGRSLSRAVQADERDSWRRDDLIARTRDTRRLIVAA